MTQPSAAYPDFASMTTAWTSMAQSFVKGATAANRAALSAMTVPYKDNSTEMVPASLPSIEYTMKSWDFERSVDDVDKITVGDVVTFEKRLSDDDVRTFASVSGDTNRLHLDDAFASRTRFGGRIVHGTLASGLISAALARLPGVTIYLSQDLEFRAPIEIGDRVSARVEIVEDLGNDQYRLETIVHDENQDTTIIDGEAIVLIDDLPEDTDLE